MKLLYELHKESKPRFTNFGDELNLVIWPALIPELLDADDSTLFVGIGTVLDDTLPLTSKKVIFGAGNGYRPIPTIDESYKIYFVRGPLTANALGLPPSKGIVDPAVLIQRFAPQRSSGSNGVVLVGHYTSAQCSDWTFACNELGYTYVHPLWPIDRVLELIAGAELVVTEAMHGAIVADALRVPWVPVTTSISRCEFKWQDWTRSVELDYDPIVLPVIWDGRAKSNSNVARVRRWLKQRLFVEKLAPKKLAARVRLSRDTILETKTSCVLAEIERLKRDAIREGWVCGLPIAERS